MQYLKALFTFRPETFQRQKHATLEEWRLAWTKVIVTFIIRSA
jgi:hypothetical protein